MSDSTEPGASRPGQRRAGRSRRGSRTRFDPQFALLVLMRTLSLVALFTAAWNWAAFLGVFAAPGPEAMGLSGRGATLYFAVLDPVAAVGLWMASPWGAVVWLLSATSRLVLATGLTEQAGPAPLALAYQVCVIGIYLYLSHRAAQAVGG